MKRVTLFVVVLLIFMTQVTNLKINALTDKEFACTTDQNYSVENIVTHNDLTNLGCFTNYDEARAFFDANKSNYQNLILRFNGHQAPNKVVAMNSGLAIAVLSPIAYIYRNPDFVDSANTGNVSTYVQYNSKLNYYDTVKNSNGQLVYKVGLEGYVGYISVNQADLLHSVYVEKDFPFTLRSGSYTKITANYFHVRNNGSYNEIFYYAGVVGAPSSTFGAHAKAPDWLAPGYYWSDNGTQFYRDFRLTQPVNNGKHYYNYFQFLPLRTRSNVTGEQLDNHLKSINKTNSVYYSKSQDFVDAQNKYGMNALLIYAMAGLESAYGTSYFALNRNNLFGWNAVDGDPNQANAFASTRQAIFEHMGINLFGYTNVNDFRFTSPAIGNKGAGFNTKYASDPHWSYKITAIAYQVDKANNFQDLNYYTLGILQDNTNVNVYSRSSLTSPIFYQTMGGTKKLINQPIAITRTSGDFYESTSWFPISNGTVLTKHNNGDYTNNIDTSLGYIQKGLVSIQNQGRWQPGIIPEVPTDPIIVEGDNVKVKVVASGGLNYRQQPSTSSPTYGLIPNGTVLDGVYVNDKAWIKVTYNGKTGYISAQYVEVIAVEPPVVLRDYRVTATNGLNVRSQPNTSSTILGTLLYNRVIKGELVENGSWVKFDYNGKIGYVSAQYVSAVAPRFADVPFDNWNYDLIERAANLGIITGREDGRFYPNDNVTRAEATVMLMRALGNTIPTAPSTYSDLSNNNWATNSIMEATRLGIVSGYADGTFKSNNPITRAELSKMISLAYKLSVNSSNLKTFKDVSSNDWAYTFIQSLASNSIVSGFEDGTFRPNANTTRSEFTKMVINALDK